MSGIVGIYRPEGIVANADLERMVETISHRGGDGSSVWTEGPIGLGHRMLHTTPESLHEKLPLVSDSHDLTITADARIDNREELWTALGFSGSPHVEVADSQLILASYERWGERCPEKLLGDFSFAIWDRRKQVLFCARDHYGVRPFNYHYRPGQAFVYVGKLRRLSCDHPELQRSGVHEQRRHRAAGDASHSCATPGSASDGHRTQRPLHAHLRANASERSNTRIRV